MGTEPTINNSIAPNNPTPKPKGKNKFLPIIGLVALIILGTFVYFLLPKSKTSTISQNSSESPPKNSVELYGYSIEYPNTKPFETCDRNFPAAENLFSCFTPIEKDTTNDNNLGIVFKSYLIEHFSQNGGRIGFNDNVVVDIPAHTSLDTIFQIINKARKDYHENFQIVSENKITIANNPAVVQELYTDLDQSEYSFWKINFSRALYDKLFFVPHNDDLLVMEIFYPKNIVNKVKSFEKDIEGMINSVQFTDKGELLFTERLKRFSETEKIKLSDGFWELTIPKRYGTVKLINKFGNLDRVGDYRSKYGVELISPEGPNYGNYQSVTQIIDNQEEIGTELNQLNEQGRQILGNLEAFKSLENGSQGSDQIKDTKTVSLSSGTTGIEQTIIEYPGREPAGLPPYISKRIILASTQGKFLIFKFPEDHEKSAIDVINTLIFK